MPRKTVFFGVLITTFLSIACNKNITPDRTQFIKDGEPIPVVDLSTYKSVQERPNQDGELAIAMSISGGGSRAANFGIGVMLGLENLQLNDAGDVLDQVDYISTVSGGGFAGGSYINALYDHQFFKRQEPFQLKDYLDLQIREALTYSYTGALVRANFNPLLWFSYVDDGDVLEKAIDDNVLGYKKRKKRSRKSDYNIPPRSIILADIFIDKSSALPVKFPMHFTNSSVINTMAIFPFTPDILEKYKIDGYTHRKKRRHFADGALDPYLVPLAVGIKASGSFPALISNSTLRSTYNYNRRFLHLIDGAMTDNTGYYTAFEVLKQDQAKRKVLIVVDADAGGNRYTFSPKERSVGAFSVYARLASSGLDARRNTLKKDLAIAAEPFDIIPIFLSFHDLIQDNDAPLPKEINPEEWQKKMIEKMRDGKEVLTKADHQILYELLVNIGTKYTMTDLEQELLFLAGQEIVRIWEKEIRAALAFN